MTTEEKRVTLYCLTSEIDAFAKELTARGARRDAYGNPQYDVVLAHLRLLEGTRISVEEIKATRLFENPESAKSRLKFCSTFLKTGFCHNRSSRRCRG